jgi:hypothetical protein
MTTVKSDRKNIAVIDRLIEAVHGSYEHRMCAVIRLANVTLWWEEKWLEENVLRTFVYVFLILVMVSWGGSWGGQSICRKS